MTERPAIGSAARELMEAEQRSIRALRNLTLNLSQLNVDVKAFSKWCIESERQIDGGGAPDWVKLYNLLKSNPAALTFMRSKSEDFNTCAQKIENGLIGDNVEETNPHSIQPKIEERRDDTYQALALANPEIAAPQSNAEEAHLPPQAVVKAQKRRNVFAVAAAAKIK